MAWWSGCHYGCQQIFVSHDSHFAAILGYIMKNGWCSFISLYCTCTTASWKLWTVCAEDNIWEPNVECWEDQWFNFLVMGEGAEWCPFKMCGVDWKDVAYTWKKSYFIWYINAFPKLIFQQDLWKTSLKEFVVHCSPSHTFPFTNYWFLIVSCCHHLCTGWFICNMA